MSYLKRFGTRRVPQTAPIPGSGQARNSAGGYVWAVDDWMRLRRFLILGSEGGSYYASEATLTRTSADAVARCLAEDGPRTVAEIVSVSDEGRAPKNDPALFALAMAAGASDEATRKAALEALPRVCRTGTHLFRFATFVEGFRGWGRSLRRAVGAWYAARTPDALAYQAVKYRQREGVTHRDLLRLAHPAKRVSAGNPQLAVTDEHARLFEWIVRGGSTEGLPRMVEGFVRAQAAVTDEEAAALVREYGLPREALKSEHLVSPEVWAALLEDMPMTALIRNLATMTRIGLLRGRSDATAKVVSQLGDAERIRRARVHPIAVLAALRTYASGRGARGRGEWHPVGQVVDALDAAFYAAFDNVEPAGTRVMLALDVSGSMAGGHVAGVPGLSPRDASAALALVTAATEPDYEVVGFFAGKGGFRKRGRAVHSGYTDGLTPLPITPRQRLDDAVRAVSHLPFGGTDCALPMLYAQATERSVDAFVIYTDNETWAGGVHPAQALRDYRRASGIDARLVVVGMVANGFSIADPSDPGMLDVVGFDTATPQLISDFARGAL
jgi:60 kDa SS-A/Ro ribonucleoprotein